MFFTQIKAIVHKELIDLLRDRRSLLNSATTIFVLPIGYALLFGYMFSFFEEQAEAQLILPTIGAEQAPNLVAYLEMQGMVIDRLDLPEDHVETMILGGDMAFALVIPDSFEEEWNEGSVATIRFYADRSDQGDSIQAGRVERALALYNARVGNLRLLARGISPEVARPLAVDEIDVSISTGGGSSGQSAFLLSYLPGIMMLVSFMSGLYIAADMTAGERERDSLEPLLMNPISRSTLFTGKGLTLWLFIQIAVFISSAIYLFTLRLPAVQSLANVQVEIPAGLLLVSNLIMLSVNLLAFGLLMLISAFVKTVREAQTYASIIGIIVFLPAIFLTLFSIDGDVIKFIPTLSQASLINRFSRGEGLIMADLITSIVVTLIPAAVTAYLAWRLYHQEKLILGR